METETGAARSKNTTLKFIGLCGVMVLTVFVVIGAFPFLSTPFYFTKFFVVFLITLLLLGLFIVQAFKEKKMLIESSVLYGSLLFLPCAYLIGSFFSMHTMTSLIGDRFESGTVVFIAAVSLMAILISMFVRTASDNLRILAVLLCAALGAAVFQIVHVVSGGVFSFLGFSVLTENVVGRWKDLGLLAGLVGALALVTLEVLPLQRKQSQFLIGSVVIFLVILAVTNSGVAWVLFGLVALGTFMSVAARRFFVAEGGKTKTGIISGIAFCCAVVFLFVGGTSSSLDRLLQIESFEVRPSIQGTFEVAKSVYSEHPVFGTGPNTFVYQWTQHRPDSISETPFWNVTFTQGSGFIPTNMTTGGILVILAWLFLIGSLCYTAVRTLFFIREEQKEVFFVQLLTVLGVVYLLLAHTFYATGQGLTILLFVFVGLFLASLRGSPLVKKTTISFTSSQRFAVLFVMFVALIGILSAGSLYGVTRVYVSAYEQERSLLDANRGDLVSGKQHIERAIALHPLDRYYRTAALIDVATMTALSADTSTNDRDVLQEQFQAALASGLENTNQAIARNPHRFENWMVRGSVIAFVLPSSVPGAYENAIATYESARLRAPKSPEIDLRIAEVHLSQGANEEAKTFVAEALRKKPDYTSAILLRARIALQENNLDEAIESLQGALFFNQQSAELAYQLGVLHLQNEAYEDAVAAFDVALDLNPEFANAAFFLAQAYTFLGREDEALSLMRGLAVENPDNALVQDILRGLERGENPFDSKTVPLDEEDDVIE